jgi:predicted CoA-binding protein
MGSSISKTDNSLAAFFAPAGVAVVGASHDPTKLGYGLSRNLVQCGYRGAIHFVNIRGGELMGRPVYRELAEVPDPVDLAVLLIPAPAIPSAASRPPSSRPAASARPARKAPHWRPSACTSPGSTASA